MTKLFAISLLLQQQTPTSITNKPVLCYRTAETRTQALGMVLEDMLPQFPDFAMAQHLVLEIPFKDVEEAFKDQLGMQPPAAPVTSTLPMSEAQFATAYTTYCQNLGIPVRGSALTSSWQAYQKNPTGHFLSR